MKIRVEAVKSPRLRVVSKERPGKKWWDEMSEEVKKGNPDYSEEQVRKTVGDIYYNKLSPSEHEKARSKSKDTKTAQEFTPSIVEGAAKALWGTMWADEMEEFGLSHHLSGTEILDVMPPVPAKATEMARAFIQQVEQQNGVKLYEFIPPGVDPEMWSLEEEENLGFYLAMEAMGHGVSWKDDHEDHGLKLPMIENYELEDEAENAIRAEYGDEVQEVDDTDSDVEGSEVIE